MAPAMARCVSGGGIRLNTQRVGCGSISRTNTISDGGDLVFDEVSECGSGSTNFAIVLGQHTRSLFDVRAYSPSVL